MPQLNRKGPNGEGAMTGRKLGRCQGENKGKTADEIFEKRNDIEPSGLGMGLGMRRNQQNRGHGRGMRNGRGRQGCN